jgi:hypothetical protein
MSSFRNLSIPLGPKDGKELSIVADWEKDTGYVVAYEFADNLGNSFKTDKTIHPTVRDAVLQSIALYDQFVKENPGFRG